MEALEALLNAAWAAQQDEELGQGIKRASADVDEDTWLATLLSQLGSELCACSTAKRARLDEQLRHHLPEVAASGDAPQMTGAGVNLQVGWAPISTAPETPELSLGAWCRTDVALDDDACSATSSAVCSDPDSSDEEREMRDRDRRDLDPCLNTDGQAWAGEEPTSGWHATHVSPPAFSFWHGVTPSSSP